MPLKVKLIALLILISGFAHAADKKDAYIKAINYCNCRIVYTYCKQYTEMKPASDEKKSYDKITYIFKCSIDKSLPFDSINRIIKRNNFANFSKKSSAVFGRIAKADVEALTTEDVVSKIISGIYESAEFKDFFTQYSEVGSLIEPLTKELTDYLSKSFASKVASVNVGSNEVVGTQLTGLQKEVTSLKQLIEENKTSAFAINWLSIILIVVFSGLVFMILKIKLAVLKQRTDKHINEYNLLGSKNPNGFNQQSNQNSNFNEFKRSAERNISDLNSALTSLQNDFARLNMKLQGNFETPQSTPQVEKQQRIETLYAPIPNRDGSFTATNVTSIEDSSSSFYKFTITDNLSQKATFEFLNVERAIRDATSSPELILNLVCRINNALNQNAKRIRTITPGVVVKHNDKWIVEKPAEIEYE